MTIKEAFSLAKQEINPKINYIRQLKENKFFAQGSSGSYDLVKYIFTVKNHKISIVKIEETI